MILATVPVLNEEIFFCARRQTSFIRTCQTERPFILLEAAFACPLSSIELSIPSCSFSRHSGNSRPLADGAKVLGCDPQFAGSTPSYGQLVYVVTI